MTMDASAPPSPVDALAVVRQRLALPRIPSLDGLRAFAVFLVILFHFGFARVNGALGVEVFFTLSGFLITWLLLRENERTGGISFTAFYQRRSLRIFPAFYAYWLFGLALYWVRGHEIPWASVVASALYVENYRSALVPGDSNFLSHTWSLAIEEQFYLLWPLLFWRFRNDLQRLTRVLVGIIAGVWILRAALHAAGVPQAYLYCAFESRMDQLAVGCLLAVVLFRGTVPGFCAAVTASPWLLPITLGALLLSGSFHGDMTYRYTVGYALEPLLTAALIVQAVYYAERPAGRVFNWWFVAYLGQISYSLYLYQQLTLFTARRFTASFPVVVQLVFAIAVTIVFAALSYHLIEVRVRAWGLAWLRARSQRRAGMEGGRPGLDGRRA